MAKCGTSTTRPGSISTGIGGAVVGPINFKISGRGSGRAPAGGGGGLSYGLGARLAGGGGGSARRNSRFLAFSRSDRCTTVPTRGGRGCGGFVGSDDGAGGVGCASKSASSPRYSSIALSMSEPIDISNCSDLLLWFIRCRLLRCLYYCLSSRPLPRYIFVRLPTLGLVCGYVVAISLVCFGGPRLLAILPGELRMARCTWAPILR